MYECMYAVGVSTMCIMQSDTYSKINVHTITTHVYIYMHTKLFFKAGFFFKGKSTNA